MNRTNLDFLFQVTAPVGDRAFCAMPIADELPRFGDHLNKAASTAPTEPGQSSRRDDTDYGRPEGGCIVSGLTTNGDGSPNESSQNQTASVAHAAQDPGEAETEETRGPDNNIATDAGKVPQTSAEASAKSDESESDDDDAEYIDETVVTAVEANAGQNAAAVTAKVTLQKSAVSVEGETQSETMAESAEKKPAADGADKSRLAVKPTAVEASNEDSPVAVAEKSEPLSAHIASSESPTDSKAVKKLRGVKTAGTAVDETRAEPNERSAKRVVVSGPNGDASSTVEVASKGESQETEPSLNELGQKGESDTGSDETKRDTSTRTATRQRGDAEAIVNKLATASIANGTVTQPRDGTAVTESADGRTGTAKVGVTKADGVVDTNRLHVSAGMAKVTDRAKSADELPRVDPARFVGRVAKAFHTAQERGGTLQLRLSPPELGAMLLELTVKDGVMTAALETETASARRVLLEHLPALRDRLAEQNIRVERFDVDVRREGAGGQPDPRAPQDRQPPQHDHSGRRQPATQPRESAAPRHIAPIPQPITDNTGINLVA